MSDLRLPQDDKPADPRKPSPGRLLIWVGVGGVGLYLIITGLIDALGH